LGVNRSEVKVTRAQIYIAKMCDNLVLGGYMRPPAIIGVLTA